MCPTPNLQEYVSHASHTQPCVRPFSTVTKFSSVGSAKVTSQLLNKTMNTVHQPQAHFANVFIHAESDTKKKGIAHMYIFHLIIMETWRL